MMNEDLVASAQVTDLRLRDTSFSGSLDRLEGPVASGPIRFRSSNKTLRILKADCLI
jgi:hypothetical protein